MNQWKPVSTQQKKEIIWCKGSWDYTSAKVIVVTFLIFMGFLIFHLAADFISSGDSFKEHFASSKHDVVMYSALLIGTSAMFILILFIDYGLQVILRAIQVHRNVTYYQYATFVDTEMNKWGIIEVNARLADGSIVHGNLNFASPRHIRDAKNLIAYYYEGKQSIHFGLLK